MCHEGGLRTFSATAGAALVWLDGPGLHECEDVRGLASFGTGSTAPSGALGVRRRAPK